MAIVLCLAVPARAETPTEDNHAEARRLKAAGDAALERHDAAAALDCFQRAYAVYPSPNMRYNIGVALDELGRAAEALDAYESYVSETRDVPPAVREHLAHRQAELSHTVAHLSIAADLAGAEVLIDGQPVGTTPLERHLHVSAAEHEVALRKPGYAPAVRALVAAAGVTERLTFSMSVLPPPAMAPVEPTLPAAPIAPASPAATVPAPAATPLLVAAAAPAPRPRHRWWIWATVGGVVLTGAAVGLAVGLTESSPPRFSHALGEGGPAVSR